MARKRWRLETLVNVRCTPEGRPVAPYPGPAPRLSLTRSVAATHMQHSPRALLNTQLFSYFGRKVWSPTHHHSEVCGRGHLKGPSGHFGAGCVVGLAVPPLPALKYVVVL
jgi:hypothetical protein